MGKEKVIELGKERYNAEWLRSVSEDRAIMVLHHTLKKPKTQVINAWKQANGKSVPNRKKDKKKED